MRYEVTEAQVWRHVSGRTTSVYGACPWTSDAERANWKRETVGFTVYDNDRGTFGIGRRPFATRKEAETFVAQLNAQRVA